MVYHEQSSGQSDVCKVRADQQTVELQPLCLSKGRLLLQAVFGVLWCRQ
jgi:hypothetical protein